MDFTIFLIGLTLAIDCFIVSVCISSSQKLKKNEILIVPFHFGVFQGGMAIIGYYLGVSFKSYIDGFDHYIAFGLLTIVGLKMIYDSRKKECEKVDKLSEKTILLLSIATSIDAFAVGIAFSMIDGGMLFNSIIIAICSFVFSLIGLIIGKKIKSLNLGYMDIIGGLVLIIIGTRVLIPHLLKV